MRKFILPPWRYKKSFALMFLFTMALSFLSATPVSGDTQQELIKIQRYIIDLQQQIWELQKRIDEQQELVQKTMKQLQDQINASQQKQVQLTQQMQLLLNEIQSLKEQLRKAESYLTPQANPADVPPPTHSSQPTGTQPPSTSDLFNVATSDYYKGQYDLAIQEFSQFVETFPGDNRVPDAHYWIAESMYSKKAYLDAIVRFENFIRLYGNHPKAPTALYKKGLAYLQLGRKAQAITEFQNLVKLYPDAEESEAAREQLKQLGITP